ncbi:hypothetical protein BaRGS_00000455 [Batillaria attramentaria]|uniref:C2H2-type domain-containing protein n=1 Tax=Batillaria attramentaria TaxID=370345 RepID=A0ABD0MAD0_9CAEN
MVRHGLMSAAKQSISYNENANTARKTEGDVKLLQQFISKHYPTEDRPIHEIPPEELNSVITKFILTARRSDGSEYEPKSLCALVGSFQHHLFQKGYPVNIMRDSNFAHMTQVLHAKQRFLQKGSPCTRGLRSMSKTQEQPDTDLDRETQTMEQSTTSSKNLNTTKKTTSNVRLLQQFISSHYKTEVRPIHEIPPQELNTIITNFLVTAKKSNGNDYGPASLYGFVSSFNRYLSQRKYPVNILMDQKFAPMRKALKAKQTAIQKGTLCTRGLRKLKTLTPEQTDKLWESKQLGTSSPSSLLNTIWWNNRVLFGIKTPQLHRQMRWGDVKLLADSEGREYLQLSDRFTRKFLSTGHKVVRPLPRVWANTENPERCPVRVYKEYARRRPQNYCHDDNYFYLATTTLKNPGDGDITWLKRQPVGQNKLTSLMARMTDAAGLTQARKITHDTASKPPGHTVLDATGLTQTSVTHDTASKPPCHTVLDTTGLTQTSVTHDMASKPPSPTALGGGGLTQARRTMPESAAEPSRLATHLRVHSALPALHVTSPAGHGNRIQASAHLTASGQVQNQASTTLSLLGSLVLPAKTTSQPHAQQPGVPFTVTNTNSIKPAAKMSRYQVVCSVIRPRAPTELCRIPDFQEKVHQRISSVFHDVHLDSSSSNNESSDNPAPDAPVESRERTGAGQGRDENSQVLCALISKTKASFSGEDNFQSGMKLPYFWCNFCPFSTGSKPSLLQHLASQHCFHCHHCPYVALTRSEVAQHSLQEHPEFRRQAREQKLKGCRLLRNAFQQNFKPEPVTDSQAARKRPAAATEGSDNDGSGPSKQPRLDELYGPDENVDTDDGGDVVFDSNSSSSDSSDANVFRNGEQGASLSSGVSADGGDGGAKQQAGIKSLSENVVSSSSIDPDTAVDAESKPEASSAEERDLSCVREPSPANSYVAQPSVTIKQEVESEDGFSFALQGSTNDFRAGENSQSAASSPAQSGDCPLHQSVHPVGEPVKVKAEPGMEVDSALHQATDAPPDVQNLLLGAGAGREQIFQGGLTCLRELRPESAASPPLSSIHVENLQRQFEESVRNINLSLHGSDQISRTSTSSALTRRSETQQPPQSARQQSRENKGMGQKNEHEASRMEVVDNFLLDSSTDSRVDDRTTLLRQLLTRAQGGAVPDRRLEEENPESSGLAGEHFLSEVHRESTENQAAWSSSASHRNAQTASAAESPGLDTQIQIKQEPADEEDFAGVLMSSSKTVMGSRETMKVSHGGERHVTVISADTHSGRQMEGASQEARSGSLLSADSDLSLKDILRLPHRRSGMSQSLASDTTGRRTPDETAGDPSTSGNSTLSPIEKLKSLSNMTLRDILTMKMPLGLGLEDAGTSDNIDMTEVSMDDDDCGLVVWECGFCHFAASQKRDVMMHREQWHSDQMSHSQMSRFGEQAIDSSDEGETPNVASSYTESRHRFERAVQGRHNLACSHPQSEQKHIHGSHPATATLSYTSARPKVQKVYEDYDYHYQSSASPLSVKSSSESEAETDDPDDRNYVPPHYLLEKNVSSGSGSDTAGPSKTKSGSSKKYRHRGKKNQLKRLKGIDEHPVKDAPEFEGKPTEIRAQASLGEKGSGFYNPLYMYKCRFCNHVPSTLEVIKRHIRSPSDQDREHLLVAEMVTYPYSVLYVCPKDSCHYVTVSEKAFLEHVLRCQGTILDASEVSVKERILRGLEQAVTLAGDSDRIPCPVGGCSYFSRDVGAHQKHLTTHIKKFHSSQMVLFHTVCSAMAKLYSASRVGQFMCYLCGECLVSVDAARSHAQGEHGGHVHGMLHILKADSSVSKSSSGLLVAVTCLHCQQRIPDLNHWYQHVCSPNTPSFKDFKPSHIPSLNAWPWAIAETKQGATDKDSSDIRRRNQLPLVRSILMDKVGIISDKRNLTPASVAVVMDTSTVTNLQMPAHQASHQVALKLPEPSASTQLLRSASQKLNTVKQSAADTHKAKEAQVSSSEPRENGDGVESLMVCDVCHGSVPETAWKQHECFAKMLKETGSTVSTRSSSKCRAADQLVDRNSLMQEGLSRRSSTTTVSAPPSAAGKSLERSYPLLTQSLHSSKPSLGLSSVSNIVASRGSSTHSTSAASASSSVASVPSGSSSLRSLLVGLPAEDRGVWDRVVKRSRGTSSILKEKLLTGGEAVSTMPSVSSTQQQQQNVRSKDDEKTCAPSSEGSGPSYTSTRSRSQIFLSAHSQAASPVPARVTRSNSMISVSGKASQVETRSPRPATANQPSAMGESADMVSWLHQQGSQMMRVLGDAMSQEGDNL